MLFSAVFWAAGGGTRFLSALFQAPEVGNMLLAASSRVLNGGVVVLSAVFRAPEDGNIRLYALLRAQPF